jgi:amidase
MTAWHTLSALAQGAAIRDGSVTSTQLTEHYLARIAAHDDALGAYVTVTPERARAQASEADDAVRLGDRPLGPLHGVPAAVKDVARIDGVRCTQGSLAYADEIADVDDHVVRQMRAAGLVLLGTTNTPEFALPCHTENAVAGLTRNPWSRERTPGGSSGGSAAAVAAGLAAIAHGTDAGGSVRIPAACCGLVGLRPSNGRISNGPVDHDATGLSSHGAIARTVADARALMMAMAGVLPGDASAAPAINEPVRHAGPLRIAVMPEPMVTGVVPTDAVVAGLHRAAAALRDAGHCADEVELSKDDGVADGFAAVWSVHAANIPLDDEEDASVLLPFTQYMRARGGAVSGMELHAAMRTFRGVGQMLADLMFPVYDVFLTPTIAHAPPHIGAFVTSDPDADFSRMGEFMPYTPLANIVGLPSIAVPAGTDREGLPLSVLVTGRYGEESLVLHVAELLEQQLGGGVGAPGFLS